MSKVEEILQNYTCFNDKILANLQRILMAGKLGNTGKLFIFPVDQGFEHGPERSFYGNEHNIYYDPNYHCKLAINAGLSAYAAPLGALEVSFSTWENKLPTILKINSANSLTPSDSSPEQAITASVNDAVSLGCSGIGLTIYPGSKKFNDSIRDVKEIIREAKSAGLFCIIWSYPRGEGISKEGETALDVVSYSAHIACLLGAHIVKVKLPSNFIEQKEVRKVLGLKGDMMGLSLSDRVSFIKRSCFYGKRMVIFSGGSKKNDEELLQEISAIKRGGGDGSVIGRNLFQRDSTEALKLLERVFTYLG